MGQLPIKDIAVDATKINVRVGMVPISHMHQPKLYRISTEVLNAPFVGASCEAPKRPALCRPPTNPFEKENRKRKKEGFLPIPPPFDPSAARTPPPMPTTCSSKAEEKTQGSNTRKVSQPKQFSLELSSSLKNPRQLKKPKSKSEPASAGRRATKDDLIAEFKSGSKKLQKRNKFKPKKIEEDPLSNLIPKKILDWLERQQEESEKHDDANNSPCSWSASQSIRPAPVHDIVLGRRDSSLETASPGVVRQLTQAEQELKKLTVEEENILEQQALICDAECQERIKNRMKYLRILRCETGVSETVTTDSDSSS